MSKNVSSVAPIPEVRAVLVAKQQEMGRAGMSHHSIINNHSSSDDN